MKAAVFHGPGKALSVEDVAEPAAGPGEMVLQVRHCGVCGTDMHITEPHGNAIPGGVIGHEFCGEIVEIGSGVANHWKVGDRAVSIPFLGCGACAHCLSGRPVWCRAMRDHVSGKVSGGFAQFTSIGALGSVKLPSGMTWDAAALVEPLAVGLHGLRRARLEPGANVLVVGSGPVGLAVAMWAKALGARWVIMTARSSAMNKELTLTFALCYDVRDFEVTVDRLARGVIDPTPMITDRVDFTAFPEAFEALRQRTHQCKVLLSPSA